MNINLKPIVTVLMPVYNGERFLDQAIRSILNQTFTDFEFLIIDDGSTDASVKIVESYDDRRIRFIQNDKNYGISATLNKGIEMARGNFIARMDADDLSYPERLEKQFAYMSEHSDCALLSTWARIVSESGEPIWTNRWKSRHYYYNLVFRCIIYHSSVMYRRDAVIAVDKYTLEYSEDYELWNRMARHFKIANLEETLLDYRLTEASLSRKTKREEYENTRPHVLCSNIDYFTDGGLDLSSSEIEFLMGNNIFFLGQNHAETVIRFLEKWERINDFILKKPNPNRNEESILEAAAETRQYLISSVRQNLTIPKQLKLLIKLREWHEIRRLTRVFFHRKLLNSYFIDSTSQ